MILSTREKETKGRLEEQRQRTVRNSVNPSSLRSAEIAKRNTIKLVGLAKSAQALFGVFQNSGKNFYSLSHN
jgi:hypothetical protein